MINFKAVGLYASDFSGGETRLGDTQIIGNDVIDGYCDRGATRLISVLKSAGIRSPYLHITHPHYDHRDGINKILSDSWFTPRALYCQDPDSITGHNGSIRSDINALRNIIAKAKKKNIPVIFLDNEQKVEHGEIKFTVYRAYPKYTGNSDAYLNEGSLCYWFPELRYLTTGDASLWCAYKYNLDPLIIKCGHHGNDASGGDWLKPSQMCVWLYKRGCRYYWDNDFSTKLTDFLMTGREDAINAKMTILNIHGDIDMVFACGKVTITHAGKTYTDSVPYSGEYKECWIKNVVGWWYRYKDGSWPSDCTVELPWSQGISTFYFNERGYMVTGWQKIDGKWYFFDEKSGAMRKGWIFWSGSWFYLDPESGVMRTGWIDYKQKRCYLEPSGRALRNCVKVIDGRVYSFDDGCYATEVKPVSDDKRDLNGADVASYQKDLRPALMTTTDFIIVKFTQGTWYVNPYAEAQYAGVKAAGKLPGVYHYGEGGDAKKEAQFFAKKLGARIGECVPGLDWEGTQNPTFGTGKDVVWCLTFCDEFYRLTGVRPVIYMSKSVCRRYDWSKVAQKYKLWCAQYASNKATDYQDDPWTDGNGFGAWDGDTIRQYSSHGHIVGYSGYIDINKAYLTKAEWLELAKPEKETKTTKATKESTETAQTAWAPEVDQVTSPARISNSGSDEHGNYKGGQAGDQTGREWYIRDWYNRPWNCVLRHPNAEVRKCLATLAVKAANNDNIGYDQAQRETYRKALEKAGWDPAKIEEAVESDCSAGVIANIIATGHILGIAGLQNFGATYTGNMRKEGGNRGFQVLTDPKYLTSSEYLLAGDIPLNDAHHVCTVVTNGTKSGTEVPLTDRGAYEIMPLLKRGSKGKAVKVLQALLGGLAIDGSFGPLTLNSVLLLQKRQGLLQDGEVGPLTWNAVIRTQPILKRGSKGAEVKAVQIMLGGLTIDGSYGRLTEAAVKRFQATHGLEQDGEVGPLTLQALIEYTL